ncbi:hypothetical protein [Liquorilactobacillus mali]|nr:hypothetical protein [Liquorilactobacillus mali]
MEVINIDANGKRFNPKDVTLSPELSYEIWEILTSKEEVSE